MVRQAKPGSGSQAHQPGVVRQAHQPGRRQGGRLQGSPVETLHATSLQGFGGFLKTGAANPDLVLLVTYSASTSSLLHDR